MQVLLGLHCHYDPSQNEKCSADLDDPVKTLHQCDTHSDEYGSHDDGAQNTPEQHAVLVATVHAEIGENKEEDKKVVDAKGLLNQITRQELQCFDRPLPEIDPQIEE